MVLGGFGSRFWQGSSKKIGVWERGGGGVGAARFRGQDTSESCNFESRALQQERSEESGTHTEHGQKGWMRKQKKCVPERHHKPTEHV